MSALSRALRRWSPFRVASGAIGVVWLAVAAAFAYSAAYSQPEIASVVAAVAALAIGGALILYAWPEPGA